MSNNNPIENASEAKIASDLDAFKSELTIQIGQKYIYNTMLETEDIDSNELKEGWKLVDLVPSIKETKYKDELVVENGELKLRIDSDLDENTKKVIESNLSAVLNSSSA